MSTRAFVLGLAGLFATGWLLREVCVRQYEAFHPQAERPVIDEASYDRWASRIASGDWLGHEVFFQEPLYAYALGAVYAAGPESGRRARARHVQAFLLGGTGVLVALATAVPFGPAAGLCAGTLWALYRPGILFAALLLKPALVLPLVALLALLLARTAARSESTGGSGLERGRAVALGLAAGLGGLLRGNLLLLVPLFVLLPLARARARHRPLRSGLGGALLIALGASAVILPVTLRNVLVAGELVPVTSGAGTNLYGGNNPDNPYGLATEFDWVRGIPEYEPDDWRREAERRTGRPLSAAQSSAFWLRETLRSVARHPGQHLAILYRKARATLGRYEIPDNHDLEWDARYLPLLRAPLPGFALVGWLGLAGLVLCALRRPPPLHSPAAALELALLFWAYFATIVLTVTSMRARIALVPLVLPFAGWLIVRTAGALRERSGRGSLEAAAALLVAAPAVFVPLFDPARIQNDYLERDFNLAAQLVAEESEPETARALVDELLRVAPGHPRVEKLAAELDFRQARRLFQDTDASADQRAKAAALCAAALARVEAVDTSRASAQERFRLDVLAGSILQSMGRFGEALERYERALEFDSEDFELRLAQSLCRAEVAAAQADPALRASGLAVALRELSALERERPEDTALADLRKRVEAELDQPP